MKRLVLGAALIFGLLVGRTVADYVVVKIDVNKMNIGDNTNPKGGNFVGNPKDGPGFGGKGPGFAGGGFPGGKGPGFAGGGFPGGKGPGFSGAGFPGGGNPGIGGAGFPGGGQQAGNPGAFQGNPGGKPFPPGKDPEPTMPPLWAYAYLEVKQPAELLRTGYYIVEHPWGKSFVPKEYVSWTGSGDTIARQATKRWKAIEKDKDGKTANLLRMAEWSLDHRRLPDFLKAMKELAALDAKHPAVVAFTQVQGKIGRPLTRDDPAARSLQDELKTEGFKTLASDRYTLLASKQLADESIARRYLTQLEETYQVFFYWFALKGKVLDIPDFRLVGVLYDLPSRFRAEAMAFEPVSKVGAGFTARRDNVIFLSPRRLDEAFEKLASNNQDNRQSLSINKDDLLSDVIYKRKTGAQMNLIPVLQTMALVEKAMEVESERATLTHEGVRQLLSATGLLPRNVAAGEWVRSGIASFFETPHKALYPSTALANWDNLVVFKDLRKSGKLKVERGPMILERLVTDRFFRQALTTQARFGKGSPEEKKLAREEMETARATAWALTYYLMKNRMDNLFRYLEELRNLPRDVAYDAGVLEGAFGRAFGKLKGTPDNPNQLDPVWLQELSGAWFSAMDNTWLEVQAYEQKSLEERSKAESQSNEKTQ
jgi:hypothetical protein